MPYSFSGNRQQSGLVDCPCYIIFHTAVGICFGRRLNILPNIAVLAMDGVFSLPERRCFFVYRAIAIPNVVLETASCNFVCRRILPSTGPRIAFKSELARIRNVQKCIAIDTDIIIVERNFFQFCAVPKGCITQRSNICRQIHRLQGSAMIECISGNYRHARWNINLGQAGALVEGIKSNLGDALFKFY